MGGGMVHENTSCKTGQFVFRTKSDTRVALFCAISAKVAFRLDAVNALIVADFGRDRANLRNVENGFDSGTCCCYLEWIVDAISRTYFLACGLLRPGKRRLGGREPPTSGHLVSDTGRVVFGLT